MVGDDEAHHPINHCWVLLGFCYNLSVQDFEIFQIQATRVLGFY
jgi:hypothetical protein